MFFFLFISPRKGLDRNIIDVGMYVQQKKKDENEYDDV